MLVHIDDDSTDITEENYQTIDRIPGSYPSPEEHTDIMEGIYNMLNLIHIRHESNNCTMH